MTRVMPVSTDGAQSRARDLVVAEARDDAGNGATPLEIRYIALWPVTRLAIAFWSSVGAFVVAVFLAVWVVLTSAGVVSNVERFVRDITGVKSFQVMSNTVLASIAILVLIGVIVAVAMTVLAAACYNALASLIGGIRFDLAAGRAPRSNR